MSEWYERWFGEEYLTLYPHRDERDAAAAVDLIERELARPDGGRGRVLDLACGAGRHARLLRRLGWTVGLDLSFVLLRRARETDPAGDYVRADMRALPFADNTFSLVTNLFTSFGYFADDREHDHVVAEIARVLRPGGSFVLDYLNADHVRASLVPFDERQVGGLVVEQRRSISPDERYVVKRITSRPEGHAFVERVRLYSGDDLRSMLRRHGLRLYSEFGSYEGSPAGEGQPRHMLFSERPRAPGATGAGAVAGGAP